MFTKYGVLELALLAAWFLLLRPALSAGSRRDKPEGPPPAPPAELAPCPKCGVYRAPGGDCDCTRSPAQRG